MTQTERLLQYMRDNGSITALDAVYDLGITRLSARIYDLSERGIKVNKQAEKGKNRYGETVSYFRYSLG